MAPKKLNMDLEYYFKEYLESHKDLMKEYKATQQKISDCLEKISENVSSFSAEALEQHEQILGNQRTMREYVFRYVVAAPATMLSLARCIAALTIVIPASCSTSACALSNT